MSRNSKILLALFTLIFIMLLSVLVLGVYSIRAKNEKISELLNSVTQASDAENLARSIRAVQIDAKEDLDAFENIILTSDKLVALIDDIESVGQTLGLDTHIVSVNKIEDKKHVVPDIIRMVIETTGAWAPNVSFIRALENLPNRVMIDESNVMKDTDTWHAKIILSLYSFN